MDRALCACVPWKCTFAAFTRSLHHATSCFAPQIRWGPSPQVRSSFRGKAHLTDADEINQAKQAAVTALGNYHALKAYEMAIEERAERVASAPKSVRRASGRKRASPTQERTQP
jgi:hypothetical protein